ncbi:unnamed protein product [Porites evermanni]|uniref:BEN domain-containing protein n=1 Tax=Porites evermanni TaxID=104178 RepID=A0ABN8PID1_9CNID|nr:unnamed protein product [Porites evermanni]
MTSKSSTDLCFTCQQNTNKLQRAANLSDREKSECVKAHQDHLNCAQSEREYYRNSCINSENALGPIDTETVLDRESREACSLNVTSVSLSASVPPLHDLSTIDIDTFESLSVEVDTSLSLHSPAPAAPAASTLETSAAPTLETSAVSTMETPADPTPGPAVDSAVEIPVAEDVIRTCVTPRKVQRVREALQKEANKHRCAVNLLPFFFTKEEIMNSNTNGSHGKQCLDSNKLNSLKVLVFSKFPAESATEKDKLWAFIKTKINATCRAIKYANTTWA